MKQQDVSVSRARRRYFISAALCAGVVLTSPALPAQVGLAWITAHNGAIPADAVGGGNENGHVLFVCHARHNGGVHPGKVVGNNCNFGYGGVEVAEPDYQVLVGHGARFVPTSPGVLPAGAYPGGDEDGHPLFICHGPYSGGLHIGKVVGTNCNIGWGGREVLLPSYEVLVQQ
jgi:hypothetical protein